MTLNYWMMMERYPNLKEEVGGLTPNCEISSLLDKKTFQVGNYLLWRWHVDLLSQKKQNNKTKQVNTSYMTNFS
jgi:hypothetical protein